MSQAPASVVVEAPAKVNLTLEILDERPDRYHNLRSVLMPVSLCDTVVATACDGGEILCATRAEGVDAGELASLPPEKHLAVRAARALRAAAGLSCGARLEIVKRIPIGAGMGGGSADAAGTLVALNALWELRWPLERLAAVAAPVGCDVPGMVLGGAVGMEGIGDRVERVVPPGSGPVAPFWLVAAFPGLPVSTCAVYKACGSHLTGAPGTYHSMRSFVRGGDVRGASRWLFNGLQETVFRLVPGTERFCLALREAGALSSLLSGSGSAVFGLAEDRGHAERIRSRLGADVWSRVLQTLPDGVMAAHGPLVP